MRLTILVAAAAIAMPAALTAASAPGMTGQAATDLSAAAKKKQPAKKKKEENLKAAPSASPSEGKSMY
jgi:ABC-type transporter MlaC component